MLRDVEVLQRRCAERVPRDSRGPKPAGTYADPFIGYGVVFFLVREASPELARVGIRHQPVPHLKTGGMMSIYLPTRVVGHVNEGDIVKMSFAQLDERSPLAREYASLVETDRPLPYVFCGHELFKIETVPDVPLAAR